MKEQLQTWIRRGSVGLLSSVMMVSAAAFVVSGSAVRASSLTPDQQIAGALGNYFEALGNSVTTPSAMSGITPLTDPSARGSIDAAYGLENAALHKVFGLAGGTITQVQDVLTQIQITQTGPNTYDATVSVWSRINWQDAGTARNAGEQVIHNLSVHLTPVGPVVVGDKFRDQFNGVDSSDLTGSQKVTTQPCKVGSGQIAADAVG